jgi:hypothetical protein
MNREKDTNARLWRRCIDDRWWGIISFPIAIMPIIPPVILIAVAVMPTSSVLITAVVMSSLAFMVISEGRQDVYTADHCGENKPHHKLASYGSKFTYTRSFHYVAPVLVRF